MPEVTKVDKPSVLLREQVKGVTTNNNGTAVPLVSKNKGGSGNKKSTGASNANTGKDKNTISRRNSNASNNNNKKANNNYGNNNNKQPGKAARNKPANKTQKRSNSASKGNNNQGPQNGVNTAAARRHQTPIKGTDNGRGSAATNAPGTPSQGNYAWSAFQNSPDPSCLPIPFFISKPTASGSASIKTDPNSIEAANALRKLLGVGVGGAVVAVVDV